MMRPNTNNNKRKKNAVAVEGRAAFEGGKRE